MHGLSKIICKFNFRSFTNNSKPIIKIKEHLKSQLF